MHSIKKLITPNAVGSRVERVGDPIDRPLFQSNVINISTAIKTIASQTAEVRQALIANEKLEKNELKIVVAGNVGSGKTTFIKAVSEKLFISSEVNAVEKKPGNHKKIAPAALEYGLAHIANMKLHIYGSPGQRCFDFMADMLCKGAHGMVVMIDNRSLNPLIDLSYFLHQHGTFLQHHPVVVTITHFDDNTRTSLLDYQAYVMQSGFTCPVTVLDGRNKNDMQKILMRLLLQIARSKTGKNTRSMTVCP